MFGLQGFTLAVAGNTMDTGLHRDGHSNRRAGTRLDASINSLREASNKDGIIDIYSKFRCARIGRTFQIPPLRLNSGLCDALARACPSALHLLQLPHFSPALRVRRHGVALYTRAGARGSGPPAGWSGSRAQRKPFVGTATWGRLLSILYSLVTFFPSLD